ncbi:MAG: hypothetical protein IKW74_08115, partial [Thermoguttaceae bacterium]|nr:hypothetical protein [Thermoguttaceae bacterium]
FKLFGKSLPGDLTQFSSVKRLVPNHFISFADGAWGCKRFYTPHKNALDFAEIVKKSIEILHNNLKLIAEKWQKPAISMSGGCDSQTTLACATGLLDKFRYFSYSSSEAEALDADSAREICEELGLTHRNYMVSPCDADYSDIEIVRKLLFWNNGSILPGNPNDVRKRCLFMDTEDFDVEVKSWCSEIGRAYYSKRFNGRIDFGRKPTPRACTALYKVFLHNRSLVRETDKVFAEYLEKFFALDESRPVEWQDQFFWEFRVPSWNGLVITGEHRISFDITIPYNNRLLLELLLSVDIRDRISDKLYWHVREMMNPAVNAHQLVVNQKHTRFRARLENLYYLFNTMLPF